MPCHSWRCRGLSYVELVIVIIILIILGTVASAVFTRNKVDVDYKVLRENQSRLRQAVNQYYLDHQYTWPGDVYYVTGKWDSDGNSSEERLVSFMKQMYGWTNADGVVAGPGDSREDYPYGPYLQGELPVNPIMGNNEIHIKSGAINPWGDQTEGWLFSCSSGNLEFNGLRYLETTKLKNEMNKW